MINICLLIKAGLDIIRIIIQFFLGKAGILVLVNLNRKEGNDQESIQLTNTFRPRHERKRRTHLN